MRKLLTVAIGLVSLIATACGGQAMSFDKATWASGKGNFRGKNPRLGMVSKAMSAGVKQGATRPDVHALLGQPDRMEGSSERWYLGQNDMAPDNMTFVVTFDSNGIVTDTNVENS